MNQLQARKLSTTTSGVGSLNPNVIFAAESEEADAENLEQAVGPIKTLKTARSGHRLSGAVGNKANEKALTLHIKNGMTI